MNLDEAIEHCYENVQKETKNGCECCATDHLQLAHWLEELKKWRKKGDK